MRGLTGTGPSRGPASAQAVITATAVLAALALFAAACGTGGTGARDEGPAHDDSVGNAPAAAAPSPSPSQTYEKVDAVALVKADPAVSATVKRDLTPCAGDEYPVDVTYGDLTGGPVEDVVVNVLTCGDAVGVGAYVYRKESGAYKNVFKAEESPVYAEIDKGDLSVTKQVYEKGDPVSSPSGENVITYNWASGRFVQEDFHHTDYGNAAGGDDATPVPSPAD
ncbi:hypothetical protein ACFZDK_14550 [Streptomyces sp. NPDC007901]|uniref:hypothetical protein n=1 Tax=Streptomyces sp. NPDC007901 TaxID=3364785 RepID=UPI0036E26C4C